MASDQVQQKAIQTYNENLEYFKQNHPDIYKNLELYAAAIDLKQIVPQFELQYLNTHFDIVNPKTKQFLYTQNSNEVSKKIADDINPDATVNSFKTFYEFNYNDKIAKTALEMDILAPYTIGNAPVINYVNKNIPEKQNLNEIHKFIIFGVLLGIHIPLIHQKLKSKVYLIVEPNLEFFRLSLFVTNYAALAKETKLFFSIAQNEFDFKKTFESFYGELFIFNHYLKFVNLSAGSDIYMKTIQNFLVSQGHLLYSYDRTFLSLSRTNSYISQNFKMLNIKRKQYIKQFEKPVLYLAAGPSLQHNIEFVKENQDYFTIVAIYAAMPILERNGIKPDIITQYDEQDIQVLNTLDKLKDINYFKNTIFIFASHVNAKLMNSFPKENIFIFQAMFELKENFGTLTSPSIGELTYALLLLLQAKEIYLLGLDFAMDVESGSTHIEGHSGSGAFNKLKDLEDSSDKNYSFRKNTILVKGNFLPEVKSVPVFKTNIDTFAQFTEMFKDTTYKVYNLSNGAYLKDAIPLKAEDINLTNFVKKESEKLKNDLFESFQNISEAGYSDADLEKLNLKLSGVKKIKKSIEQFQKIKKYKDFEEYKSQLINLIQNILFEKLPCEDLQSILINYSSHNLHHLFYLFDLEGENDKKKYIYEINKNLLTQLNKIVDTYVISISYSSDENSIALKKLNKYLKEYSIKNSIYSEPFFKELVETSKRSFQYEFEKNSMGFLAIEDNLSNKDFIDYVKKILSIFPEVKLKLFYFFDFQKVQAQYIFKQELNKVELLIPHNISNITTSVEFWLETYNNTINIKRLDDIILNNYENIYSTMFDKKVYEQVLANRDTKEKIVPEKFALAKNIEENFILPTTNYFRFANSLKDEIDKNLLNETYLKDHIGFFAIKENLQNYFIQHIINICNKFPNVNFSVFFFDEEDVQEFINVFKTGINRFKFITPKSIYDITDNTEIWIQASIKNQSFLHDKIYGLINNTVNIHPIVLKEEYIIKDTSTNYLESLIENYHETIFAKTLNDNLDEERLQNTTPKDNIGFLATEDNLKDSEFIKLMTILFEKDYGVRYKAFYFNEEQKELTLTIFGDYIQQIDFIIPKTIYDIVENISTYIYSFISYKKPKTFNYHKVWQILNETKANLFKIHLFNTLSKSNNYHENIKLIIDSKMLFQKSVIADILQNSNDYDKYLLHDSLDESLLNNEVYCQNTIGFIASSENLNDNYFVNYIKKLMKKYTNVHFKGFYFNDAEKSLISEKINDSKLFSLSKINNVNDLLKEIEVFISNGNNPLDEGISAYCFNNSSSVCGFTYKSAYDKLISSEIDHSNNPIIKHHDYFGISENTLKTMNYDGNYILHQLICDTMGIIHPIEIEKLSVNDFWSFIIIDCILKHNSYKLCLHKIRTDISNFKLQNNQKGKMR